MQVLDVKIRDIRVVARLRDDFDGEIPEKGYCLVDHEGDREYAKIKTKVYPWEDELPPEHEVFFVRPFEQGDFDHVRSMHDLEKRAFLFCLDCIRTRDMDMALAAVEQTFDEKKLKFYFTAEHRIDFRDLVKELAAEFKTRIEMRQIGVRDRSKKIGGYGLCGQELCCSRFLRKFEPITIRMAKEQNLALNPTKISGLCGRLMCCLSYEVGDYQDSRRSFPPPGTRVRTPYGEGTLGTVNYVRETVNVSIEDGRRVACSRAELTILSERKRERPPRKD